MTNPQARPLSEEERAILERLLEPHFPGRDQLRSQLDWLLVRPLDDEGCLAFECRGGLPAEVRARIPAEGEGLDGKGGVVHVQLHVIDGFIHSLVIWNESSSDDHSLPPAVGMKVFAPYSEDAGVWNAIEKFR